MTESVRKMAQFFLKPFPYDVNERHIKLPEEEPYFRNKFAAVLGGSFKTEKELLDKVLLANSLLDHANRIFLVGEIGIAAIASMGFKVSKVDRCPDHWVQTQQYKQVQPFIRQLLDKAADRGV